MGALGTVGFGVVGPYFGGGGNGYNAGVSAPFIATQTLIGQNLMQLLMQILLQQVAWGGMSGAPVGGGGWVPGVGGASPQQVTPKKFSGTVGPYGGLVTTSDEYSGVQIASAANNASLITVITDLKNLADSDAGDALYAASGTGNGINPLTGGFDSKGYPMYLLLKQCLDLRLQGKSAAFCQTFFDNYCVNVYGLDITP